MQRHFKWLFLALFFVLLSCGEQPQGSAESDLPADDYLNVPYKASDNALDIVKISSSTDDGNGPKNALDRDFNTRWSAKGDGQWLRLDLGKVEPVVGVTIAFYRGRNRVTYFDVETSKTGKNWKPVYSGESSGKSVTLEAFDFTPTDARYIRIIGHKNTENNWNSLTEVEVLGKQDEAEVPGTFTSKVVAQHSDKCLDVYRDSREPGAKLIQYRCNGADNQRFTFVPAGETGTYTLSSVSSDLCLAVSKGKKVNGQAILEQTTCNSGAKQRFDLKLVDSAEDDVVQIVVKDTGKCIGVDRANPSDRASVVAMACTNSSSQYWQVPNYSSDTPAPEPPKGPLPKGNKKVDTVDWAGFTRAQPTSRTALDLEKATLNANKYMLTTWWNDVKNYDAQRGTYLDFGGKNEHFIRHPGAAAVGLAVSLTTGIYKSSYTGVSKGAAKAKTLKLIRSLAYRHRATTSSGWGRTWQSALWAHKAGFAAWLLWDELSADDQASVLAMLEYEANRFVGYNTPYYRSSSGEVIAEGNTRAEENAWNASLLHLALTMMPDHPARHAWAYKNAELKLSSYAQPSDLKVTKQLHGRPVKDWLYGSNAYDDGIVINHSIVHPDYMAAIEHHLEGAIVSSLARKATPAAALYNTDVTYKALVDLEFKEDSSYPDTSVEARAPGGTMYIDGSGDLYYPQGNSWGTDRVIPYVLLDALAASFKFDTLASKKADYWANLHTGKLLEQQARHSDGRTYATAQEDKYKGREAYVNEFAALAYLSRWLVHQNAFSVSNSDYGVVIDNRDVEFTVKSGSWATDKKSESRTGEDAKYAAKGSGEAVVQFSPRLSETGRYRVYAWWACGEDLATNAPYSVHHAEGKTVVELDQSANCGQWTPLGSFSFNNDSFVTLSNDADGKVMADAVMFIR